MAIRLLSVDVDGTITNGRNQVTQATADALRRAAAAGVIVTLVCRGVIHIAGLG